MISCTLAILLAQVSCNDGKSAATESQDAIAAIVDTTPKTKTRSYLALGDSYTIGESIDSEDRYPAQAAALVNAMDKVHIPVVHYIAVTGWTTKNLQNAIASQKLRNTFDVVTLLIGVNDLYQGIDTGTYAARFTKNLQTAVMLARNDKKRVIVVSIPDYGATPFAGHSTPISLQVDKFNIINKRITDAFGITYLNVTSMSRAAATDFTLLADDRLHYSAKEYSHWADSLAPLMEKVLM